MFYTKDNKSDGEFSVVCEHMYDGAREYYIGNFEGSKIGDLVYYRDDDGFWVRNLLENTDNPVDFLNEMNIDQSIAVGFLDEYIVVENKSHAYPIAEIYDLYDYAGNEIESHHREQLAEQVYRRLFAGVGFFKNYVSEFLENICDENVRKNIDFIIKTTLKIKENGDNYDKELADSIEKYYSEILDGLTVEDITVVIENIMGLDHILSLHQSALKYEERRFDEDDSWADLPVDNCESIMSYKKRLLVDLRRQKGDNKFGKILMDYKELCASLGLPY